MLASSRTLVLILLAACLGAGGLATPAEASAPVPDDTALHTWRAARRAEVRARSLAGAAKTLADPEAASARFGLLVIPVDFADHRLPAGWDPAGLAPRLTAVDGQSLRHYFNVASAGRCEVVPILAPLVRLPGIARDYSDIGLNGFTRSRRLAALAIEAVAAAGFDLRAADLDGPDGRAGTADDDGWVDGVLILHADPGQENDAANGLIQALQYYLDPPFAAEGITAGPYATASLASGPGIWAHETAHLLGMEDRYDPLLPPDPGGGSGAGDLAGAGGLGVFSLMAAGALGTGGGWGPSLPDAYSRALLGWCDVVTIASSPAEGDTLRAAPDGTVAHRVWTRGEPGSEFFLLEARDPGVAVPFDAALPAAGLVALHVDETVPEGSWRDDGFEQWHLRARLVEADGGRELRDGLDAGAAGDVFPGPGSVTSLAPDTTPSSDGYEGPTGVAVSGIGYANGLAVHHTLGDAQPWLDFDVAFGEGPVHEMVLTARVHGGAAASLSLRVEAVGEPVWGDFGGGSRSVEVPLLAHGDGAWRPASTVRWTTPGGQPTDAFTRFRYTLSGPGVTTLDDTRSWTWTSTVLALDFAAAWPGSWTIEQPDGPGTAWERWTGADSPAAGQVPVLVCTAAAADPTDWPNVAYTNGGRARLTSGPLAGATTGVRLLHWVDVESLPTGAPMDAAVVSWIGPDGLEVPAEPLRGWPARVDPTSGSALRGRGSFGGSAAELTPAGEPIWRTDIFPVPAGGTGPWRLRLEFAANALWRARGWVVARCEALSAPPAGFDEDCRWSGSLSWDWTWDAGAALPLFDIQARARPDSIWTTLLTGVQDPVDRAAITALLPGPPDRRHEVRVTGPTLWGVLALEPLTVYVDDGAVAGPSLGEPWPNPAMAALRFTLQVPDGTVGELRIYDLRGRLVHRRDVPAGTLLATWDGSDAGGRRLPSGTYFLKLSGAGAPVTRKVVLRH